VSPVEVDSCSFRYVERQPAWGVGAPTPPYGRCVP